MVACVRTRVLCVSVCVGITDPHWLYGCASTNNHLNLLILPTFYLYKLFLNSKAPLIYMYHEIFWSLLYFSTHIFLTDASLIISFFDQGIHAGVRDACVFICCPVFWPVIETIYVWSDRQRHRCWEVHLPCKKHSGRFYPANKDHFNSTEEHTDWILAVK